MLNEKSRRSVQPWLRNLTSRALRCLLLKRTVTVRPVHLLLLFACFYVYTAFLELNVDLRQVSLFRMFDQRYDEAERWGLFDVAQREFSLLPVAKKPRYLVMYSGPTAAAKKGGVDDTYASNFRFFLKYGLHPNTEFAQVDFVIVLTNHSLPDWKPLITQMGLSNVHILVRRPECYDMQSFMTVLKKYDYRKYDRVIAVNCGLKGPFVPPYVRHVVPWTSLLASLIDDSVKLAGLSQNQGGKPDDAYQRHVQSMMWVTDAIGMRVIMEAGCFFDCTKAIPGRTNNREYLIQRYEIGLSVAIKKANYSLRAWNNFQLSKQYCKDYMTVAEHDRETYPYGPEFRDEWFPHRYFSRASPYETMFVKVTRKLSYSVDDMDQAPARKLSQCDKESRERNQAFYNAWYQKYITPR